MCRILPTGLSRSWPPAFYGLECVLGTICLYNSNVQSKQSIAPTPLARKSYDDLSYYELDYVGYKSVVGNTKLRIIDYPTFALHLVQVEQV